MTALSITSQNTQPIHGGTPTMSATLQVTPIAWTHFDADAAAEKGGL